MKVPYKPGARLLLVVLLLSEEACRSPAYSFGPLQPPRSNPQSTAAGMEATTLPPRLRDSTKAGHMTTRLVVLEQMAATFLLLPAAAGAVAVGVGGGLGFPAAAQAAKGERGPEDGKREWISGKGAQPKGSDDKTGTRRESRYLRCLSNCLASCQKPTYGPELDREECLQSCQDECCSSYEQCTYTVTQNK